jgi:hypothetical protein
LIGEEIRLQQEKKYFALLLHRKSLSCWCMTTFFTMHAASRQEDHCASANVAGDPRSTKSTILETGAALTQDFSPVKKVP